jgi:hypothetical protein
LILQDISLEQLLEILPHMSHTDPVF